MGVNIKNPEKVNQNQINDVVLQLLIYICYKVDIPTKDIAGAFTKVGIELDE